MLTGENGILSQAQNAKEETEKARVIEQARTDILGKQTETGSGDILSVDLKEILDKYFKDVPSANEIKTDTVLTTRDEYGENYKITVSEIYDGNIEIYSVIDNLEIGEDIFYSPSGTYEWKAKYYKSSNDTDMHLDSSTSGSFNISNWKVLDIDKNTGEVKLVPKNTASGTVSIFGAQGYNNGVKLLNEACNYLYGFGGEREGITARSINIEDIEYYMTGETLRTAHESKGSAYIDNELLEIPYGEQVSKPYPERTNLNGYMYGCPNIYQKEKYSVINGDENTNPSALELSEQDEFLEETELDLGEIKISNSINAETIQPYQTYYTTDLNNGFKSVGNSSKLDNFQELFIKDDEDRAYWIASRYVNMLYSCEFGIRVMSPNGWIMGMHMFESLAGTEGGSNIGERSWIKVIPNSNSKFRSYYRQ